MIYREGFQNRETPGERPESKSGKTDAEFAGGTHLRITDSIIQIARPTPVLNTPNFSYAFGGTNGKEIPLDSKGHPFCYEFVALEGTPFKIEKRLPSNILQVSCSFYSSGPLYIDERFVNPFESFEPPQMPEKKAILEKMIELLGAPYVWGGNWSPGIPELFAYYPPHGELDAKTKLYWSLAGIDCSGLLYQATRGATPRNTRQLIHFGEPLTINDINELQPLDMIIYPGHVVFVLDKEFTIESKYPFGVIKRPLKERFQELMAERTLVNQWTPGMDASLFFTLRRLVCSS